MKPYVAFCLIFWIRVHSSVFIYKGRKKSFTMLLKFASSSGKLTSNIGEVVGAFCLQAREMKPTSLQLQSKMKWWHFLISWNAEFLFWALKIFHNMKFIKVKIYSVPHVVPTARHSLPLTLDKTVFSPSFSSLLKDITSSWSLSVYFAFGFNVPCFHRTLPFFFCISSKCVVMY